MDFAAMGVNDERIVSGCEDSVVRIWDNEIDNENGFVRSDGDGREICRIDVVHDRGLTSIVSNEDGTILISSIVDKYVGLKCKSSNILILVVVVVVVVTVTVAAVVVV